MSGFCKAQLSSLKPQLKLSFSFIPSFSPPTHHQQGKSSRLIAGCSSALRPQLGIAVGSYGQLGVTGVSCGQLPLAEVSRGQLGEGWEGVLQLAALAQTGTSAAQSFIDNSSQLSVNQSPARNESILALGSFGGYEMKLDEDRVGFQFKFKHNSSF